MADIATTETIITSDRDLVDAIVYLASLAAQPQAIDAALDTLRIITANWAPETPLDETDRAVLKKLATDLKDYLINRDPLRSFTEQTLEQRLQENLKNRYQTSRLAFDFNAAALGSLGLAEATILIPSGLNIIDRIILSIPIFLMLITLTNAWFYLTSLKNFKIELRKVFSYICIGTVGLGVQFLHFTYIQLAGLGQVPLYKYGGLPLIGLLSFLAFYIGLRKYTNLLKLNNKSLPTQFVGGILLLGVVLVGLSSYLLRISDKSYFILSLGSVVSIAIMAIFNSQIAHTITDGVTPVYALSIRRLYLFFLAVAAGSSAYTLVIIWIVSLGGSVGLSGNALSTTLGICATPALLLLLHSGYSFKKETSK